MSEGLTRLLTRGTPTAVRSLALGHDPTVWHAVYAWTIGRVHTACGMGVLFSLIDGYSDLTKTDCMACIARMNHGNS